MVRKSLSMEFLSPQNQEQERWRRAIKMGLNAAYENINISQSCYLSVKYRMLFEHAYTLKAQHNNIIHHYGLPESCLNWKAIGKQ